MIADETIQALAQHAGLGDYDLSTTVAGTTYGAIDEVRLEAALDDCFEHLKSLNVQMNGPVPSAATEGGIHSIPRRLVYSLLQIIDMANDVCHRVSPNLRRKIQRIEIAWAAVVAGDSDDLERHVELEFLTRSND